MNKFIVHMKYDLNNWNIEMLIAEKFQQNIKSTNYLPAKSDASVFSIRHYAGKVTYDASLFLEKNRNFLPPEVVELFRLSNNTVVQFLFQCPLTKTGNLFAKVGFIPNRWRE